MKILHISKFAYPERGGIESFVRDLTARQKGDGHDVSVLCHHANSGLRTDTSVSEAISITRAHVACSLSFAPLSPAFPFLLRRIIRKKQPSVLHLHLPNPAVLFSSLLPRDIPLIVQWHADVLGSPSKRVAALYPAYRIFENQCLAKATRIIASSPPYQESSPVLSRWKDKCRVVPLGLDQSRYPLDPSATRVTPPLIASVGRFTYYKGYEHLLRAAALTPDAEFVIAGDGPLLPGLRSEVQRLGLTDRVRLPGGISDNELHALLQTASIFCLPSVDRGEAFGMSQLEAMRYGLPLVSTAIPGSGTGWVNQDRITGFVVPPASPEALAEAFRKLLHHPGLADSMGQAARQRYEDNFTIGQVAEAMDRIYAEVAG